jgi:phage protein U
MGVLGYKIGVPVMMQLGSFQFGITTAAFQSLQRTNEWRWPSQDRIGKPPVLQYVGQGSETITLPGVIYPEWRGGLGQMDAMRAIAGQGEPLTMIDGRGRTMGLWVIERIEEKQAVFADAGVARKVEFTLQLRRFFETENAGVASAVAGAVSTATGAAIPAGATGPVSQVTGLAKSVADSAKAMTASISKAYQDVQATVAPYTAMAADSVGAVMRCAEVANELQTTANRVLAVVGKKPINITAISAAQTMASKAGGLLVSANSAGALLRGTVTKMEKLGNVAPNAVQSVRAAAATAEKTAALARQTANESAKITE